MWYAVKLMDGLWFELEPSRDRQYLESKYMYEGADIIGGW